MLFLFHPPLLLGILSCIIECKLGSHLASILAFECKLLPNISLTTSELDYICKVDPCFSNEVGLLVVVEHRHLELVIVGRVVHSEAQLLIPSEVSKRWRITKLHRPTILVFVLLFGLCLFSLLLWLIS